MSNSIFYKKYSHDLLNLVNIYLGSQAIKLIKLYIKINKFKRAYKVQDIILSSCYERGISFLEEYIGCIKLQSYIQLPRNKVNSMSLPSKEAYWYHTIYPELLKDFQMDLQLNCDYCK